jgi:hypothetical protein
MTLQESMEPSKRRARRKEKPAPVFEIINGHSKREFRLIEKERLMIPVNEYQRDESDGRIAADVAMHFDLVAFLVLGVIERANGTLVVFDGGTRLAGALQREDIIVVPCMVYSGLTPKEEADVFLRVNLNRRRLRTEQQHHAELYSEEDIAIITQQYTDLLCDARVGWDGLTTMRSAVKKDLSACDTVVRILTKVAVDKHVTTRVMKGLVRLERLLQKEEQTLNRGPVVKKLAERFGHLDAVVNALVEPRRQGDPNVFARALAKTLHIKFPRLKD